MTKLDVQSAVARDSSLGARCGLLTVGATDHLRVRPMMRAVASLAGAHRCLLAIRASPQAQWDLIGTDDGCPPTAAAIFEELQPSTRGSTLSGLGWVAPVVFEDDIIGAALVDGPDTEACRHAADVMATAASDAYAVRTTPLVQTEALRALVEVGQQIHAAEVDADSVLAFIVDRGHQLLGADVTWLALNNYERNISEIAVIRGAQTPHLQDMRVRLGDGLTGLAMSAMQTVGLDDETHCDIRLPIEIRSRLRDEGLVSLVCAPLRRQGKQARTHGHELIGNLLIGFRRRADVPSDARYLLTALSSQAATTITNSRLYASLVEQNEALRQHSALNRALTDASLEGGGQDAIAAELARAVGADVVVTHDLDDTPAWLYPAAGGAPQPVTDGWAVDDEQTAAISAGGERLGTVSAIGRSLSDFHRSALGIGATAIALELTKERAVLEAEWRNRGELLDDIIRAGPQISSALRARARHAGVDVDTPQAVAVLHVASRDDQGTMLRILRGKQAPSRHEVLIGQRADQIVVTIALSSGRAHDWLSAAIDCAAKRGVEVLAGLSDPHTDLGRAYRLASAALRLAQQSTIPGTILTVDRLGPLTFLLDSPDTEHMHELVRAALGPVARHDEERHSELLSTLRAFLDSGCNHPVTAQRCAIHLNTVKYRLARITELLARSPSEPSARFELSLAFSVLDVLTGLGIDALEPERIPKSGQRCGEA